MFNSELFKISEEASQKINLEQIENKNREIEKKVLEIIKQSARHINEYGIVKIEAYSYKSNRWYDTLYNIIKSGKLKYYEEEYALYFIDNQEAEGENLPYDILIFIWNSTEYYQKHKTKTR